VLHCHYDGRPTVIYVSYDTVYDSDKSLLLSRTTFPICANSARINLTHVTPYHASVNMVNTLTLSTRKKPCHSVSQGRTSKLASNVQSGTRTTGTYCSVASYSGNLIINTWNSRTTDVDFSCINKFRASLASVDLSNIMHRVMWRHRVCGSGYDLPFVGITRYNAFS